MTTEERGGVLALPEGTAIFNIAAGLFSGHRVEYVLQHDKLCNLLSAKKAAHSLHGMLHIMPCFMLISLIARSKSTEKKKKKNSKPSAFLNHLLFTFFWIPFK